MLRLPETRGDYSVLLADADGVIVETLGEPGQVVAAGQIVIRLAHGPREATAKSAGGNPARDRLEGERDCLW